ncbi:MAG: DUF885 domain-containing protein, partial [Bifidobacteriaceae bacterium]|nr:DUF885 domain-containing protein [Bifidobacteriaceae bacterium]
MSEIDKLCDNFFLETLRLEPESAIMFGLQDKLDDPNIYSDFSPKGRDKYVRLCKNYIQKVNNIVCQDIKQNIVKQQFLLVLNSSLNMEEKWHDSLRFMNNLFSPFQSLRTVFDLMPRHTTQDFVNVLNRLKNIPKAVDSYIESLELGLNENIVNTKRQCLIIIEQIKTQLNSRTSFFQKMINEAKAENINFEVIEKITKQIELVFKSFVKLQQFLEIQYLPKANLDDAVGKQRYLNYSAHYVGQKIDLDEAYQWGVEQIDEIIEQQFSLAKSFGVKSINKIQAIKQAAKILNNLDNQAIIGADNLQKYMQNIADSTMKYLITNNHFDIPKPIQKIQAMIVPTGDGVVYYTPPSADFSIPGRMWWSIPTGVKKQYKWNSKTTIFHEGVPGHHLQVGLQVYLKDKLNDWQRMGLLISGYAEGWALYAEKLMDEFGMLDNYEKFGMLD